MAATSHSSHWVTFPQVLLTALSGIHNLRFWRFYSSNALTSLLYLGNMGRELEAGARDRLEGPATLAQGFGGHRNRREKGE